MSSEVVEMAEVEENPKLNKKLLIFCQSGVTTCVKELSKNLLRLLPHSRPEVKYGKDPLSQISDIFSLRNAYRCIFFQVKKRRDAYMWISYYPNGPSIKFLVENIENSDKNFSGNCMKGTRPIILFDQEFDSKDSGYSLVKNILGNIFQTPKKQENNFYDHIIRFTINNGKIWFRNYELPDLKSEDLVEIGPRFSLNIVSIFEGTFSGKVVYKNPDYVAPVHTFQKKSIKEAVKCKKRHQKRIVTKKDKFNRFRYVDEVNNVFKNNKFDD